MTPENFCYWLQGRAELSNHAVTPEEWTCIVEHLRLVFDKKTETAPGWTMPVTPPPISPGLQPTIFHRVWPNEQKKPFMTSPWNTPPTTLSC